MPDVEYAFLADAADARPGHKFAVIGGGVSRVGGPTFPLRHPHLSLVVGLLLTAPELGSEHEIRFVLLSPDGQELSSAEARIRAAGEADGRDTVLTFGIDLWNLSFPDPGDYSFRILIDGSERKRLPLIVERRQAGAAGEGGTDAIQPPFPPPPGRA
jgi:hypothetical protein